MSQKKDDFQIFGGYWHLKDINLLLRHKEREENRDKEKEKEREKLSFKIVNVVARVFFRISVNF